MKGSLEGVLPMLGLLLMALVLSVQTLPISTGLSSALTESAEDIGNSASAKSESEHLAYHFLPDASSYSLNDAAYELGQDNAGISWNSIPEEPEPIYNDIEQVWENKATSILEEDYISTSSSLCNLQNDPELSIFPETGSEDISAETSLTNVSLFTESSDNVFSSRCGDSQRIVYREEDYVKNLSSSNRYPALAIFTAEFYVEAEDQYDEASIDDSYTGTDSSCPGSGSRSDAEDQAESRYNSDTPSFSSVASEVSDPSETSSSGSTTDNYRVSFESEDTTCRVCSGEGEDRSCSQRSGSRVTATVTPTYSEMYMDIETDEEIVLNQAYRNLVLEVDEYSYSH